MAQILLLDDEILVVEAIRENICWESCGVDQVFLCDNVRDAKQIVELNDIALVITDIEMPGEDGLAFARWLREYDADISVMFLTGYAEFSYARAAVSLKAEDYILKPVRYASLRIRLPKF